MLGGEGEGEGGLAWGGGGVSEYPGGRGATCSDLNLMQTYIMLRCAWKRFTNYV